MASGTRSHDTTAPVPGVSRAARLETADPVVVLRGLPATGVVKKAGDLVFEVHPPFNADGPKIKSAKKAAKKAARQLRTAQMAVDLLKVTFSEEGVLEKVYNVNGKPEFAESRLATLSVRDEADDDGNDDALVAALVMRLKPQHNGEDGLHFPYLVADVSLTGLGTGKQIVREAEDHMVQCGFNLKNSSADPLLEEVDGGNAEAMWTVIGMNKGLPHTAAHPMHTDFYKEVMQIGGASYWWKPVDPRQTRQLRMESAATVQARWMERGAVFTMPSELFAIWEAAQQQAEKEKRQRRQQAQQQQLAASTSGSNVAALEQQAGRLALTPVPQGQQGEALPLALPASAQEPTEAETLAKVSAEAEFFAKALWGGDTPLLHRRAAVKESISRLSKRLVLNRDADELEAWLAVNEKSKAAVRGTSLFAQLQEEPVPCLFYNAGLVSLRLDVLRSMHTLELAKLH